MARARAVFSFSFLLFSLYSLSLSFCSSFTGRLGALHLHFRKEHPPFREPGPRRRQRQRRWRRFYSTPSMYLVSEKNRATLAARSCSSSSTSSSPSWILVSTRSAPRGTKIRCRGYEGFSETDGGKGSGGRPTRNATVSPEAEKKDVPNPLSVFSRGNDGSHTHARTHTR